VSFLQQPQEDADKKKVQIVSFFFFSKTARQKKSREL
jgi:hypothetical protein